MSKNYYIGCSGYYYPYWKNRFYPKGVAPKDWLAYYSSVFNTVELNGTFYRTPKLADLQRYAQRTPDDFKFSVKMSRYITHVEKLSNNSKNVIDFQSLIWEGLGGKLDYFLFQMPPSFLYSEENLQRLVDNIPHHPRNVIELRHISWWNEHVENAFKTAGFTFCNVDFPKLESYFIHTSSRFYLRFHGSPELFKSSYDLAKLEQFAGKFPEDAEQYNIYFNNTYYEAGYTNAQQLKELIHA